MQAVGSSYYECLHECHMITKFALHTHQMGKRCVCVCVCVWSIFGVRAIHTSYRMAPNFRGLKLSRFSQGHKNKIHESCS